MRRPFQLTLVLALLVSLLGASRPLETRAAGPIASGKWTGYFTRDIVITNTISGILIQATGNAKGDLTLQVDANGGVTGTVEPYHADIKWSASALGVEGSCTLDFAWEIASGTVSLNAAHLPVFDLQLNLLQSSYQCNPSPGSEQPTQKNGAHFEAKTASGGKITGEGIRFATDQVEMALSNVAKSGAKVSLSEYWELNSSGASVDAILPDFEQYFLEGVPFENQYTASVDWHGNPPGKVSFSLAGDTKEVPGEAEVSSSFDLGKVPGGKNPLQVTAIDANGQASGSLTQDVIIVPLEPWAQKANFTASETKQQGIQHVVIYHGKSSVPAQPIELPYLDLSDIPVIGGKWGIPPFQVDVNLQATSGGGLSDPAPVAGQAGLFLGGGSPELSMKVNGQAVTNLTENALLLDHGQVDFKLDPVTLEHNVGLVDLIPAASALYSIPVVGDLIKGANSVLGITLQLTAEAQGQGDLAVAPDQSQLIFDKGQVTPSVLVAAKPGLNIPQVISLGVGGGGKGVFTIRIAPNPGLENCQVSLQFTANVAVLNLVNETYNSPPYQIAQCKQAAMGGKPVLVVYLPPSMTAQLRSVMPLGYPASPPSLRPPPLRSSLLSNGEDTILVSGVAPQAGLDLGLGPQGRMAFAYTTGNGGGVGLRLYDGQAWGELLSLGEADRLDFSPVVAFDGKGQVVMAWVQPAPGGLPAPGELESYARSWEIAYPVVHASGQVSAQVGLTQDSNPDFAPQLARAADGSLWLAWLSSPAANLWGPQSNPNRLLAARWDGKRWSQAETVSPDVVGALGFRLAARDRQEALVAASLDVDGDPATSADREIFAFRRLGGKWGAVLRLTKDAEADAFPLAAYTPEGTPVVAWQRGASLAGLEGDLKGEPQVLQLAPGGQAPDLASGALLAGAQGELALLWTGFAGKGQGVWLAHRPAAGGDWQPAVPLATDLGGASGLSARLAQNGDIWFGLEQLQVPESSQNLPGVGNVNLAGLPASADLAVIRAASALQPLPETPATSSGEGLLGGFNPGKLLLVFAACAVFALLLAIGLVLLLRGRRRVKLVE